MISAGRGDNMQEHAPAQIKAWTACTSDRLSAKEMRDPRAAFTSVRSTAAVLGLSQRMCFIG
ncbi:hypothetical protein FKP32DRAFT_1596521 [Trametes sanguinea]|nr:hypothetical protein FKP32DRAFT_1596521 [Trametes sanguinea]